MTTYKNIHGKKIKFLASDPPGPVAEGQVWYNGTDFKTSVKVSAWASGGNINVSRDQLQCQTIGTQTAGFIAGGTDSEEFAVSAEEYNGSSWTAQTNLPREVSQAGGLGTQTAAYIVAGGPRP